MVQSFKSSPASLNLFSILETKQVRLHIGGLPAKISEKDIEDRFRSFGTVQKVDLIPHPFEGKAKLLYYDFK